MLVITTGVDNKLHTPIAHDMVKSFLFFHISVVLEEKYYISPINFHKKDDGSIYITQTYVSREERSNIITYIRMTANKLVLTIYKDGKHIKSFEEQVMMPNKMRRTIADFLK